MEVPRPDVDVVKCAEEVKTYLRRERFNLVDSDKRDIEALPSPDDPSMPELCKFRGQHEELFAYISTLEVADDGKGYPFELAEEFRTVVAAIEREVNSDHAFWDELRQEIIPLYGKIRVTREKDGSMTFKELDDPMASYWNQRWRSSEIFYDPIPQGVETTMQYKNHMTGEVKKGTKKVISKKVVPAGFVIRIK